MCRPEPIVIAVTGAIGAGKTTLASALAADYGALHLSSDDVRLSLSRKARRHGDRVFDELHRRFERAIAQGRAVVLDSTGMSPRFRALLRAHRERIVHVHLVLGDPLRFQEREQQRTDRVAGALPFAAFARSCNVGFHEPPDVVVQTDEFTVDEAYREVSGLLRGFIR